MDATQITASCYCVQVAVGEDPSVSSYPTTDLLVYKPTTSVDPRRVQAGAEYAFRDGYQSSYGPGDVVGYVKTVTGSTTLYIDESG